MLVHYNMRSVSIHNVTIDTVDKRYGLSDF